MRMAVQEVNAGEGWSPQAYRYRAFLSYARADMARVDDMYRRLTRFRTPRALLRSSGDFGAPPRVVPIFLDRKSLQLGALIPDRLQGAIHDSAFLVVFCSRAAAKSEWVGREIAAFLEQAPSVRVLPVFLRTDAAEPLSELLPAPLAALGDALPLGADMVIDGGPAAVSHKLLGAMLGFPQDRIAREQERDDRRRRVIERTALSAIAGLSLAAAVAGWSAFNEARKAQTSLQVSLDALDKTTPFARGLIAQGRVTTAEVEGFGGQLDRVFASFSADDLRALPDIRFSLGQVLLSSAQLNAAMGDADARLASAQQSFNYLSGFVGEPGPGAQIVACDAALELGAAQGAMLSFAAARAAAQRCDAIAVAELRFHDAGAPAAAQLYARRAMAKNLEARLFLSQDNFAAAVAALAEARGAERLGALSRFPELRRDTAGLSADLTMTEAAILEGLEEYEQAADAYLRAEVLSRDAGVAPETMATLHLGLARALGQLPETRSEALARLDALIVDVTERTERDAALRAERATLAQLLLERAALRADIATPGQAAVTGDAQAAFADIERAGALLAELLAFDPNNVSWRLQEAGRRAMLGDFYFRLYEAQRAAAPICGAACPQRSTDAFDQALEVLTPLRGLPSVMHQIAEVELRKARTLRESGARQDAASWIERAERTHAALVARVPETRALGMQRARILDERADLAAANGRPADAAAVFAQVLEVHEEAARAEPRWIAVRRDLLWTRLRLAESLGAAGDATRAAPAFAAACAESAAAAPLASRLVQQDRARLAAAAAAAGHACAP